MFMLIINTDSSCSDVRGEQEILRIDTDSYLVSTGKLLTFDHVDSRCSFGLLVMSC